MLRINDTYENTIIINKSEFITHLYRVNTVDEVDNILSQVRKKYYDATHNCYAYIIGDNQDIQKASDDGEPQKTAGAPMLDVLKKKNMTNILAITTRYFGGILLGAGGLVRAYSESVAEALKLATIYDISYVNKFKITLSYAGYNTILTMSYITITDTSFTDEVIITGYCDINKYKTIKDDLYKNKINPESLIDLGQDYLEIKAN
ncbi:MAG: YigZ family protein [Acholeplasmatales bacterium]|nr:YigZ family protein [Acholeplasmatales bacterium]